ncbi:tryptophan synthase beta subunit-like PLP-dependent enzyme [Aspergillus varians]
MSPKLHLPLPLPDSLATLPRVNLLYPFFSPIHALERLSGLASNSTTSSTVGGNRGETGVPKVQVSLYAKREDHASPLACSGNKYRKLEYIVPDILAAQPRYGAGVAADLPAGAGANNGTGTGTGGGKVTTLVTEGAVQSNHTVQVASVASKIGLESVVLLHKGTGGGLAASTDKQAFLRTGNVQVVKLLGSDVRILGPSGVSKTQDDLVEEVLEDLRRQGKTPYWIPSGASLHPLGGLGYARCAFEIAAQEKEGLLLSGSGGDADAPRFDYVFVACGSGSTLGGLIAGFKLLEKTETQQETQPQGPRQRQRKRLPRRVIGILTSPTKPKPYHEERILRFARRAGEMVGLDPAKDITMDDVVLDDRFTGSGYGVLDVQTKETLSLVAEKEQVMLDPVYTAKVVRGMMHWVTEGEIERDVLTRAATHPNQGQEQEQEQVNTLFIHTGGQSALAAYADI